MINGLTNIEIYEIDGEFMPDCDHMMIVQPRPENDDSSEFAGDDEHYAMLTIEGHTYTVSYDELATAISVAKLIAAAR